ncbi:hypothetical protein BGZ63DRAFT_367870, partial [Mariannaea sp. PMI_226]
TMDPDDAPYLCMSDTRCRLCQFALQEGDLVFARIEYERFSSVFPLRMRDTIHDNFEWVNYHTCGGRCMMAGRRVPFFHSNCLRFRLYAISDALLAAGEYTYEPPADEEHRRFTRTRRLLAPKLNDVLQIRLPPELLTTIAGLLVRECAIITSEQQSMGKSASDTLIDLSRDVYVSYPLWMACITNNHVSWVSPKHPTEIIDLRTLSRLNKHPQRLRMNSFSCNVKGTTGYTVATHGHSVAMIHAHGCDDDTRFYVEMDTSFPRAFLAHMPLDDGEYVTEICRRYALGPLDRPSVCLVFITNKGRNSLFGTSGPPDSCRALDQILAPAPDGSRIYYSACDSVLGKSIRYLAFKGIQSPIQRAFPPSLIPNSPFFWTQSNEPWFVSSCNMEGIVHVTLCRDVSVAHKPILGILLDYENGHRDCLGQFRYDKLLQKVRVSWHGTLEWWSSLRHSILRHTSAKGEFTNMAAPT